MVVDKFLFCFIFTINLVTIKSNDIVINSWLNYKCNETLFAQECNSIDSKKSAINLIYSKSTDSDHNLASHFISSTIGETPAFFLFQTESTAIVNIDWEKLLNYRNYIEKAITVDKRIKSTIGVLFTGIYFDQYDKDEKRNGTYIVSTKDLIWDNIVNETFHNTSEHCIARFILRPSSPYYNQLNFTVNINNNNKRYTELPRIYFNNQSLHIQANVGKFFVNQNNLRLRLNLTLISSGSEFTFHEDRTIDDEYSPGVFRLNYVNFIRKETEPTYIKWKPIAYTARKIVKMVKVMKNNFIKSNNQIPKLNRPFYGFYTSLSNTSYYIYKFGMDLGSKGEEYFAETNLTSFSFVIGTNYDSEDEASLLVRLIVGIGFGVPLMTFVFAIFFVAYKRFRRQNDSQLLLIPSINE